METLCNNLYWLDGDAEKYLMIGDYTNTGVYTETDKYHAEIIAYYDSNGSLKHTGRVEIVTDDDSISNTNDLNTVWVISKWDAGCIYRHRADVYLSINGLENYNVKYFVYNHNHNIVIQTDTTSEAHHIKCTHNTYCQLNNTSPYISSCVSNNELTHNIMCSLCNYQINANVSHIFSYNNVDANYHRKHCEIVIIIYWKHMIGIK